MQQPVVQGAWFGDGEYADGGKEHSLVHSTFDGRGGAGIVVRDGQLIRLYGQSEVDFNADLMPERVRWRSGRLEWEGELETTSLASPRNPNWFWQCGAESTA